MAKVSRRQPTAGNQQDRQLAMMYYLVSFLRWRPASSSPGDHSRMDAHRWAFRLSETPFKNGVFIFR
jgi:hypothetical protein